MAPPPPAIDFCDDLDDIPTSTNSIANTAPNGATKSNASRTLLLAPPSLASHPAKLTSYLSDNCPDRSHTDVQMLDRLSMGLVALPDATFDLILLLSDADGSRSESTQLLDRIILAKCVQALKPTGILNSQDNTYARSDRSTERTEAVLAGLIASDRGMQKPVSSSSVPLKLGRKVAKQNIESHIHSAQNGTSPNNAIEAGLDPATLDAAPPFLPAGVGFDNGDIDLDALVDASDDDLIDEDSLLTEEDKKRPVAIPAECQPVGRKKRRRACKDCTCGLAAKIEAEDASKRAKADAALAGLKNGDLKDGDLKNGESGSSDANGGPNASGLHGLAIGEGKTARLGEEDLAEVDFTVPGKVGSCGNCALGDAFRCDGCPYVGLPAFKPGEEVRLQNEVQL